MIDKMYFKNLVKALKSSQINGIACYIDERSNSKCWLLNGEIIYFESKV